MTGDLGVSTYTALGRRPLPHFLESLAAAGLEHVELLATPPHVDLEHVGPAVTELRAVLRRTGVRVTSVVTSGIDVNLASTHAGMRRWSQEQFLATVRLAAELGAAHVIVHPGRRHPLRPPPVAQLRDWVLDGLDVVATEGGRSGVRVLLENVPTGLLDTAGDCAGLVREMGGRIGLCYDVANGFMVEDVPQVLAALPVLPELVHVSDTRHDRWLHDPLGTGEVPWGDVAAALLARSYGGRVVLETLHETDDVDGFVEDAVVWTESVTRAAAH